MGRLFKFLRWLDTKAWDFDWNRRLWKNKREVGLAEALVIILGCPIVYVVIRLARLLNRVKIKGEGEEK